jgi:hypothetical protein
MNAPALEAFLARLYSDAGLLSDFMRRPAEVARAAGLDSPEVDALLAIDREGLSMAAASYAGKRASRGGRLSARATAGKAGGRLLPS